MGILPLVKDVTKVNIAEAKSKFAALSRRAELGETIVITRHGKDIATLGPVHPHGGSHSSILGAWRNEKVWIAEDFDVLGPEWDEYVGG